jgi:hypothetical protein
MPPHLAARSIIGGLARELQIDPQVAFDLRNAVNEYNYSQELDQFLLQIRPAFDKHPEGWLAFRDGAGLVGALRPDAESWGVWNEHGFRFNPSPDERRRRLERGGRGAALLRERMRSGELSHERVYLAAGLGHHVARELYPDAPPVGWTSRRDVTSVIAEATTLLGLTLPARLSADYAEHVLPAFGSVFPGDERPRKAIEVAREWANKPKLLFLSSREESHGPAREAARGAERAAGPNARRNNAAWNAAHAAGKAAEAAYSAAERGDSLDAAARAGEAAGRSRRAAPVWVTEAEWQRIRLVAYLLGEVGDAGIRLNPLYHTGVPGLRPGAKLRPASQDQWSAGKRFVEDVFERVRREEFSHLPSRIGAVFMSERPGAYSGTLRRDDYVIYEVGTKDPYHRFDMDTFTYAMSTLGYDSIFGRPIHFDDPREVERVMPRLESIARSYWRGMDPDEEDYFYTPELLSRGTVKIKKRLRKANVRRNADEGMRHRETRARSVQEQARVLVDRMRRGELPRWRLNMLRVLDYPPAEELVSYAEIHGMFPMRPRGADSLVFAAETLVPEDQRCAVLRVAGVGQVALLERLVYQPLLGRMRRLASLAPGHEYETLPFRTLQRFRAAGGSRLGEGGEGWQDYLQTSQRLMEAAGNLGYHDWGGELTMNYYLHCLVRLDRLMHAPVGDCVPAYRVLRDELRQTIREGVEIWQLNVVDLEPLALAVMAEAAPSPEALDAWVPQAAERDNLLHDHGIRPALTRWLLA